MYNVIVFGGSGQLGQALRSVNQSENWKYFSSAEANVADENSLEGIFEKHRPEVVINCSAYTAVDKAEDEPAAAKELNELAPERIARYCKAFDCLMVHVSTDFVFGGDQTGLLAEKDQTGPTGVYGQTKLDGEQKVQEMWHKHIIIRTSWLYSEFAGNFCKTMLRLGAERDQLSVVADQVGTPTYAVDLAKAIVSVVESTDHHYGLYHYSNEGVASWYDFAHEIFEIAGLSLKLQPIKTVDFPTKASRPAYSVLDKSKIKKNYQLDIPHWRESLKTCIDKINAQ